MKLVLDTSVAGYLCHPRRYSDVKLWYRGALGVRRYEFFLPEIVDFELRRELLRLKSGHALAALDAIPAEAKYIPLTTATMRDAAALWAGLWGKGLPVGSADALGADVILAAQARAVDATVVTANPRHLGRMVPVAAWTDL